MSLFVCFTKFQIRLEIDLLPSLKEFLQTSVHPKGYKPKADWRGDFLIETEEQFKELFQGLLQLEQYQEVLRLYCSTKVEKLKAFEKSQPITFNEKLIYETSPSCKWFGECYRGQIEFGYFNSDIKVNKLVFEFSHQGMKTKRIRCQVDFKVLPNALTERNLLGKLTTKALVISEIKVSYFDHGFPFSLINKTLLEGLIGVPCEYD